jgi:hypothetical protein
MFIVLLLTFPASTFSSLATYFSGVHAPHPPPLEPVGLDRDKVTCSGRQGGHGGATVSKHRIVCFLYRLKVT